MSAKQTVWSKKIIFAILAVIMVTVALSITMIQVSAGAGVMPQLIIDSASARPGETVEMNIILKNAPEIKAMSISNITYDNTKVLLTKVEWLCDAEIKNWNSTQGRGVLTFDQNTEANGAVVKMTFEIQNPVEDANINISCVMTLTQLDNTDDEIPVEVEVVSGKINIHNVIRGDVDGNDKVNSKDPVYLLYHVMFGSEDYPINQNGDMDGNGKVNSNDAVYLLYYVMFGAEDYPIDFNCTHTSFTAIPAKSATCTEEGNIAYWYCSKCGKYFSDANGNTEITLESTVIPATGHTYSEEWSYDEQYHWHGSTCGHDIISDKAEHKYNENFVCTVCGYDNVSAKKLATPIITKIEYDKIYWTPVENGNYYTVVVNDNYTRTLKGDSISLSDVFWDGNQISEYGYVKVTVRADGYGTYKESDWSAVSNTYFYVPSVKTNPTDNLIKYSIGFGYNLIEDEYFDITKCSQKSVFNVGKLLTIGDYTARNHSGGTGTAYNYDSIDEFISKTKVSFEYGQTTGCVLLGSLKMQIGVDLGFDYRTYEHNNTYIYEYNWTYKDHIITNFSNDNLLLYCLSDDFLKDVRRESISTAGMTDDQLFAYLYNTYGTHAILGITTGGTYIAEYVISTNDQDIAASVKVAFDLSTGGGGAIDQIIQKDFNIGIDVSEDLSWKNSTTEAHFTTFIYGGSGGGATTASGVDSAIKEWTKSLSEDNARSVMFTKDGAIALSTLISYVDSSLGIGYSEYVDSQADEAYHELYNQYTKPTSLPMEASVENGKNVLRIDLSSYQRAGTLGNAYSPNLLNGILTVYPVMYGKYIDKIVVIGAFDNADSHVLIDNFSISLAKNWNSNVDVVFENCGIICASNNGIVDTSNVTKNIKVNIDYVGTNIIKGTSGRYLLNASINSSIFKFAFDVDEGSSIDLSTIRIKDGEFILPIAEKEVYDFGGWFDEDGNQVSNSLGEIKTDYNIEEDEVILYPKWNAHVIKISLDNQGAKTSGTKEYYEQYANGFYSEYECISAIISITKPERIGYVFGGYYDSVSDNNSVNAAGENQRIDQDGNIIALSTAFDGNTTLYALWTPAVYKIKLNNDCATTSGSKCFYVKYNTGIYSDEECLTSINRITVPSKTGYVFAGYYDQSDNKQIFNAEGELVLNDLKKYSGSASIKAKWTEGIYTISLENQNATTSGTQSIFEKYGQNYYSTLNCDTVISKINIPMKTGYTFGGYYEGVTNNNTTTAKGTGEQIIDKDGYIKSTSEEFAENKTIFALWVRETYTLTLNWNESAAIAGRVTNKTESEPSVTVTYGEAFSLPTASCDYCSFVGWVINGKTYKTGTTWDADLGNSGVSVTATASWERNFTPITTASDLSQMEESKGVFVLMNNVDVGSTVISSFSGTFDGNEKTLSGWRSVQNDIGIFGFIKTNYGTIQNITIKDFVLSNNDPNVHGTLYASLLCGENKGTIKNIHIVGGSLNVDVGSMDEKDNADSTVIAGAVCGYNNKGKIIDCSVTDGFNLRAYVGTAYQHANAMCGGLIGYSNNGTLTNISSYGNTIRVHVKANVWRGFLNIETEHGAPRGYVGGVIGYSESDNVKTWDVKNNTVDLNVERSCDHDTNIEYCKEEICGKKV